MGRFLPLLTAFVIISLFIGLAVFVSDPTGAQLRQRDLKRQQDVEAIADLIESYATENGAIPHFSAQPQQIGTEEGDCALETKYCEIEIEDCINLNHLTGNRVLSVPSDLKIGSYYKTGYAVSYNAGEEIVTVIACGTEGNEEVATQKSLEGLLLTATEAAQLKNNVKK